MNSLRFPLEEFLFPPLALSDAECAEYEHTAHILIARALAEYDQYNLEAQRRVNRAEWTPVKKRNKLTVFKATNSNSSSPWPFSSGSSSSAASSSGGSGSGTAPMRRGRAATATGSAPAMSPPLGLLDSPPEDWTVPALLQVGSIPGTLDDVMYGAATFDAIDMLLEASYTDDEALDAETLFEIQGPTSGDPFRFLGIKWLVLGNPPGINMVVRPRDMVFLEATGLLTRPAPGNGDRTERLGFHLMHSVHLPGHGPLLDKKIVRARTSSCFLFRQLPFDNAVDVFMKSQFDPSGSVAETLAIQSAAHSLTYCGQATECAAGKKLAWMLRQRNEQRPHRFSAAGSSGSSTGTSGPGASSRACLVCHKEFGSLFSKRAAHCQLCQAALCSSCHVKKKISFPGPIRKEIDVKTLAFCSGCLSQAGDLSTFDVARQEVSTRRNSIGRSNSSASSSPLTVAALSFLASRGSSQVSQYRSNHEVHQPHLQLDEIVLNADWTSVNDRGSEPDLAASSSAERQPSSEDDDDEAAEYEIGDRVQRASSAASASSDAAANLSARGRALPRLTLIEDDSLSLVNSMPVADAVDEEPAAEPVIEPLVEPLVEPIPVPTSAPPTAEEAMFARIAQLRTTAESVYQYARLNTEAHLSQSATAMSKLQALELEDELLSFQASLRERAASATPIHELRD